MKTLTLETLPALPSEVKNLVRDGVYALYGLRIATGTGGTYVLVTKGREFYVLSSEGSVLGAEGATDISSFEIDNAFTFQNVGDAVAINHA